jgi:hypothetical protein
VFDEGRQQGGHQFRAKTVEAIGFGWREEVSMRFLRQVSAVVFTAGAAGLALASPAVAAPAPAVAAPAPAVAGPVVAGLTITPSTTTVGNAVQVVATATNTTGSTIASVSMGVHEPSPLRATGATGTGGCTPRTLTVLIYCGVQNLAPGATATLTFTVTPGVPGSFSYDSYARITYTSDDTFANATLTVN